MNQFRFLIYSLCMGLPGGVGGGLSLLHSGNYVTLSLLVKKVLESWKMSEKISNKKGVGNWIIRKEKGSNRDKHSWFVSNASFCINRKPRPAFEQEMHFSPSFCLSKQTGHKTFDRRQQHSELNNKTFVHLLTEAVLHCNVIMKNAVQQRSLCVHGFFYSYSVISKTSFFSVLFKSTGARLQWLERLSRYKLLISLCPPHWLLIPCLAGEAELNELSVLGGKWSLNFVLDMVPRDFCADLSQHTHLTKSWGATYLSTESDEPRPRIVFFPSVIKPSARPFWTACVVLSRILSIRTVFRVWTFQMQAYSHESSNAGALPKFIGL